jgi:hypothetical protein
MVLTHEEKKNLSLPESTIESLIFVASGEHLGKLDQNEGSHIVRRRQD